MASERELCIEAVDHALANEWRAEDIEGLLRGAARYANGHVIPVCTRCRRMEYEDGLIMTEVIEAGEYGEVPIVSGAVCPPCLAAPVPPTPEEGE